MFIVGVKNINFYLKNHCFILLKAIFPENKPLLEMKNVFKQIFVFKQNKNILITVIFKHKKSSF